MYFLNNILNKALFKKIHALQNLTIEYKIK